MIITETNFNKIKDIIKKNPKEKIIFHSDNEELNRKVAEKLPIQTLLLSQKERKDKQKQRDSGLNQVLGKILQKNKINLGIDIDEIKNSNVIDQSRILARIAQNIKLCNKYKIQMQFISISNKKYNKYDLKSLGATLKMPTWMTKNLR